MKTYEARDTRKEQAFKKNGENVYSNWRYDRYFERGVLHYG
jgi:hypothetical protein